jgi:hypothetical protein
MTIERFYTTSITNTRMTWSGDSSAEVSVGSFWGHVQQAQPEMAQYVGEALGKVFTIWCDEDTDIAEGDTLTIASGDYAGTYSVKALQVNATGNNKHFELVVIKDI